MDIKNYNPDKLVMAEYNPRQLTKDQYQDLKDSIQRFGLVDPLIVNRHKDRKNILVGGHQRLRIARDLGIEEIPCVEVNLPLDQEKELNIRLNKNLGEWDYDALANYFDVGELTEWGFKNYELGVNNKSDVDMNDLWEGMPEYENEDLTPLKNIIISFESEDDLQDFAKLINQKLTMQSRSIRFPKQETQSCTDKEYVEAES